MYTANIVFDHNEIMCACVYSYYIRACIPITKYAKFHYAKNNGNNGNKHKTFLNKNNASRFGEKVLKQDD